MLDIYPTAGVSNIEIADITFNANSKSVACIGAQYVSEINGVDLEMFQGHQQTSNALNIGYGNLAASYKSLYLNFDVLVEDCAFDTCGSGCDCFIICPTAW